VSIPRSLSAGEKRQDAPMANCRNYIWPVIRRRRRSAALANNSTVQLASDFREHGANAHVGSARANAGASAVTTNKEPAEKTAVSSLFQATALTKSRKTKDIKCEERFGDLYS
jgi:hypothetical protein